MPRYLPAALGLVVIAVAIAFGIYDHRWIEPAFIVLFVAAALVVTRGRMGR